MLALKLPTHLLLGAGAVASGKQQNRECQIAVFSHWGFTSGTITRRPEFALVSESVRRK